MTNKLNLLSYVFFFFLDKDLLVSKKSEKYPYNNIGFGFYKKKIKVPFKVQFQDV